ncbi:hypothetical protein F4775DRAFT_343518 [Biscogniauxia sp. FL1348]|nr:hypothetical protein F4775DRAFT_343518 [Biscogniauxia sp. FL1348]
MNVWFIEISPSYCIAIVTSFPLACIVITLGLFACTYLTSIQIISFKIPLVSFSSPFLSFLNFPYFPIISGLGFFFSTLITQHAIFSVLYS